MTQDAIAAIRNAARNLAEEALATHSDMVGIPANAQTADGYAQTVNCIAQALSGVADEVGKVTVPESYLRECWGENLEHAQDYLSLGEFAPRQIVTARLAGESDRVGLHFTNNYDLYWGPKKERAGSVAQIMALKALRSSGVRLKRSVFLTATPDAYIGGEPGAGYVAAVGIGRSDRVIAGSLGGPGIITIGYKGLVWAKISIRGKAAHGARAHEGRNAIEAMMWVQSRIMEIRKEYSTRACPVAIEPAEASAPSITMCRIAGNLGSGFVAPDCALYVDRRVNPGETVAQVRAELESLVADARKQTGFEVTLSIPHAVEPSYTSAESDLCRSLARNLETATSRASRTVVWSHYLGLHYFTEAWQSEAIAYTPGRIGHEKVNVEPEDDDFDMGQLVPTIEALAVTAYEQANRKE
ncbi:MAG: peptidase dimerization domain-containing protein [Albidovulum sp.]